MPQQKNTPKNATPASLLPSQRKCSASWCPSRRTTGFGKTGRLQHKRCRARNLRRSTAHLRDYCLYTPRAMLTRQPEGLAGEVNRLRYSFRCNPSLGETGQAECVESTFVITILLHAASDLCKYRNCHATQTPSGSISYRNTAISRRTPFK